MFKYYDEIIKVGVLGEGRRGAGCKKAKRNTCLEKTAVFSSAGKESLRSSKLQSPPELGYPCTRRNGDIACP